MNMEKEKKEVKATVEKREKRGEGGRVKRKSKSG